jgi:hypothetical protein
LATIPEDDTPQPTVAQRVRKTVTLESHRRPWTLLVIAAAGSFAPDPAGAVIAMACVIAASDLARKR